MGALVAGEVVPVAVEEVGEDLRLDLAGGKAVVAVFIALVSRRKGVGADGGAVRVDVRSEDDGLGVRRPEGVVGLSARKVSCLGLLVAPVAGSKSASQTCWPSLRPLRKRMRLPSGENWRPSSPGWATANLIGASLPESGPAMGCSHSSAVFVF